MNAPSTNDAFLVDLGIERLSEPVNRVIYSINIVVGNLQGLGIAVDGSDGIFDNFAAGLQAPKGALDLLGKKL
jgi:hypothetical protein